MSQNVNGSVVDIYDPASCARVVRVGGRELRIESMVVKDVRRFVVVMQDILISFKNNQSESVAEVVNGLFDRQKEVFPIIFAGQDVTQEFVENHFTIPILRRIMADVVAVNCIEQLFPFLADKNTGSSPSKAGTGA